MRDEGIELFEAAIVEQYLKALACHQLAARVLLLDALRPAALQRIAPQLCQARQLFGGRQRDVLRNRGGPSRDRTCDPPVMSRML